MSDYVGSIDPNGSDNRGEYVESTICNRIPNFNFMLKTKSMSDITDVLRCPPGRYYESVA